MKMDFDSKIFQCLSTAFDYVVLAFLWLLGCLPVLTAGAATSAAIATAMRVGGESTAACFFRAFKDNFKTATLAEGVFILLGIVAAADVFVCLGIHSADAAALLLRFSTTLALFVLLTAISLAFGIIARFDVTLKQLFYNIIMIMSKHTGYAALLTLLTVLNFMGLYFFLSLGVISSAIVFYLKMLIFNKIFEKYMPREADMAKELE